MKLIAVLNEGEVVREAELKGVRALSCNGRCVLLCVHLSGSGDLFS